MTTLFTFALGFLTYWLIYVKFPSIGGLLNDLRYVAWSWIVFGWGKLKAKFGSR